MLLSSCRLGAVRRGDDEAFRLGEALELELEVLPRWTRTGMLTVCLLLLLLPLNVNVNVAVSRSYFICPLPTKLFRVNHSQYRVA